MRNDAAVNPSARSRLAALGCCRRFQRWDSLKKTIRVRIRAGSGYTMGGWRTGGVPGLFRIESIATTDRFNGPYG